MHQLGNETNREKPNIKTKIFIARKRFYGAGIKLDKYYFHPKIQIKKRMEKMKVYDGIIGLVVGDALGVPFEFKRRDTFKAEKITGYGTYNQPPGTWSDDSSLTLATVASIGGTGKIDLADIMDNFLM